MDEKETVFVYLDELRESSITNMFGAAPYLQKKFYFNPKKAKDLLIEWMETFEARHPTN